MATKTISITTEAYERLANLKEGRDSFSDVINKITRKYSLLDLVGILDNKGAKELKSIIKRERRIMDKEFEKRSAKIGEALR